MPLYEYQCSDCGSEFEKMVRFSEADQAQACPTCRGQNTRKKISAFAALGGTAGSSGSSGGGSCGSGGGFT
jgi:putative FmdB family regulatory protein